MKSFVEECLRKFFAILLIFLKFLISIKESHEMPEKLNSVAKEAFSYFIKISPVAVKFERSSGK